VWGAWPGPLVPGENEGRRARSMRWRRAVAPFWSCRPFAACRRRSGRNRSSAAGQSRRTTLLMRNGKGSLDSFLAGLATC
jgi:hypothetical protein